jgi:hypothetical protein
VHFYCLCPHNGTLPDYLQGQQPFNINWNLNFTSFKLKGTDEIQMKIALYFSSSKLCQLCLKWLYQLSGICMRKYFYKHSKSLSVDGIDAGMQ